jgi:5-methylcytosine-specific restriction endonuclease McrA
LSVTNSRQGKRYLLQKHGIKCWLCLDTEHKYEGEMVPIPLILDHIDGNSDNWKLPNLRLVCGRCDMLLPTYKNKNKGNGRHKRRERYAQGKSY